MSDNNPPTATTLIEFDTTSKPAKYDGTRDGYKCLAWLKEVKRYFAMKSIPEQRQTIHAINLLNQSSLLWWESLNFTDDCSFDTFTEQFKRAYMPHGFIEQVRASLLTARLTSNLAEFLTRLRLYMNILLSEDPTSRDFLNHTAKVIFIQGCPEDLQQLLQADQVMNPTISFTDMCAKAEGFDAIYSFGPKGATKGMFARLLNTPRPIPPPTRDPMAMEIDHISTQPSTRDLMASVQALALAVNAMSTRFNNPPSNPPPQTNNQPPSSQRLASLTPEEKALLIANNGCFRCRRYNAGHYARDCGRNRGALNNIDVGAPAAANQPGNASGN